MNSNTSHSSNNHTKALPSAGHRDRMLAMVLKNEVSNHEAFFFLIFFFNHTSKTFLQRT